MGKKTVLTLCFITPFCFCMEQNRRININISDTMVEECCCCDDINADDFIILDDGNTLKITPRFAVAFQPKKESFTRRVFKGFMFDWFWDWWDKKD